MAKGQKRSTREPRKPKQAKPSKAEKAKLAATPRSFLESIDQSRGTPPPAAHPTGPRR
jgi:hypothetical protein